MTAALLIVLASIGFGETDESLYHVEVRVTSPLPAGNVPLDPKLDLGEVIRDNGGSRVLDPNSIEVIDSATGLAIPFARTEDFAYGDAGRLEWVIGQAGHTTYEIRFRAVASRQAIRPQPVTPRIGTGDLLRYNANQPRPLALNFCSRLIDLTGDGKADLVGTWNYAYRPGDPWNGVVCYPRTDDTDRFEFNDWVRVRYAEEAGTSQYRHFDRTYMTADFADFDRDGRIDLVYCPSGSDQLHFYLGTGQRDAGGMPVFVAKGPIPRQTTQWDHMRAADLNADGAMDILIGNLWLRNQGLANGLPDFAKIVSLEAGDIRCVFDVDGDGQQDAIVLQAAAGAGLSNYQLAWRRNQGGSEPHFADAQPLSDINARADHPIDVGAVSDGSRRGLLVTQQHGERIAFFQHIGKGNRFELFGHAQSVSAVMSLGDQAWPYACDWDADGDLDLLVGGGYGWPRIVINDGTSLCPAYREAEKLLSAGLPIRLTRNEILGSRNWHDMGYSYPACADWDGDGLADLILPNETNRIFWYKNIGTSNSPRFGERQQIQCDELPDSPQRRAASARLADDEHTPGSPYPKEEDQPFFWRTGAAFADFNGDSLPDFVTHDGSTRQATLFVQYRGADGQLRLRKQSALRLRDGRTIDDSLVAGSHGWTESFRAVDWDRDGLVDLIYSLAGQPKGGSIHLLRNVGSGTAPVFEPPRALRVFGELINITGHGPHPWAGDLDGDGLPDLLACVEWSVYPFFSHNAIEMASRPTLAQRSWVTRANSAARPAGD